MSGRLVSAVLDSALPAWLKPYAAALASFAHDDGSSVYPTVGRLARMVGKRPRATQYALEALRRLAVLTIDAPPGRYRPTRYQFHAARLPQVGDAVQPGLFDFSTFPQPSTAKGAARCASRVQPVAPDPSGDPSVGTFLRARERNRRQFPE